ncbi:MAG: hypothetical protein JWR59_785, partial [Brevundimonas sp.]|nr:hypothetical protein [Brevundimonas sp.]
MMIDRKRGASLAVLACAIFGAFSLSA